MRRLPLIGAILSLTALAWRLRFVQDDAFISFRYAAHLAGGKGLVWNVGERVEGYTNFLWTLMLALAMRARLDPVAVSYAIGMVVFPATLFASFVLARRLTRSDGLALVSVIAVGSNYTFAAYATGGLETCLQACLVTMAITLAVSIVTGPCLGLPGVSALAVVSTLALLTRLDSILLLAGPLACVALACLQSPTSWSRRMTALITLAGIPAVTLGSWFAWKLAYYGEIFPNSFYLKVAHGTSIPRGIYYIGAFAVTYLLVPFPVLWLMRMNRARRALNPQRSLLLVAPLILWTLYVVLIGGDFMEFRLAVPVWPIFAILAVASASRWLERPWSYVLIALFPIGSLAHALTFDRFEILSRGVVTIPGLARQLDSPLQDWSGIGRYLHATIGGTGLRIAVTAAGAIPYYSELPSVDMLGVSDPWVARHGVRVGDRPGHQRLATVAYLRQRHVDLILGQPIAIPSMPATAEDARLHLARMFAFRPIPDPESLPAGARLIGIPFDPPRAVLAISLDANPVLAEMIRTRGWVEWPLTPSP
jgi:arabinofuranosyltransferase